MRTILRCEDCGNAYDADERPDACDCCGAALYGPERPAYLRPGYWDVLDALFESRD